VPREIDDQAAAQRSTGDAAPRAPRDQRQVMLLRVAREDHDVLAAAGIRNPRRAQLVQAGVRGVHGQRQRVKPEFALQCARQVFGDPLLLLVHGG
jgi:hypothetical protein